MLSQKATNDSEMADVQYVKQLTNPNGSKKVLWPKSKIPQAIILYALT